MFDFILLLFDPSRHYRTPEAETRCLFVNTHSEELVVLTANS